MKVIPEQNVIFTFLFYQKVSKDEKYYKQDNQNLGAIKQ
jgi:hypothetical protein